MKKTILMGLLFVPLVASNPAAAALLSCNGAVTTIIDESNQILYIDDRESTGQAGGVWLYAESGVLAGLQSGGNSIILGPADADSCAWGRCTPSNCPDPDPTHTAAQRDILIF